MLKDYAVHPSLATSDIGRAKAWYAEKLGWTPVEELDGQLAYLIDGSIVTVFETPTAGTAKNTVAIWEVEDLRAEVARLRARGLAFEEYDFDDLKTVDGIATDENGVLNAWFRDADGNYISVVEMPLDPEEIQPKRAVGLMVAASDLPRAKKWYTEILGLKPPKDYPEDAVFIDGKTRFTVYRTGSAGTAQNTIGVWRVGNLRAEVAELRNRGVTFEDYDFGEWGKTVNGVLEDSDGDLNAWFKDSEGNVLGLAEDRSDWLD
jgi:catechol 2,3-dioxygenase-like lactoylglutathione lyase family enzyme